LLEFGAPHMKRGGVIVADNAIDFKHLMKPFLKKIQEDSRVESTVLPFDNGLALVYKK